MLLFGLLSNVYAIQNYEATPFIGKEVDIVVNMKLNNSMYQTTLSGVLLSVETITVDELNTYYLVLEGEYVPYLIPCQDVILIRRAS